MITTKTTLNELSELVLPIFNEFEINDVWVVGNFLQKSDIDKLDNDSLVIYLVYDNSKSQVKDDVDKLFLLNEKLYNVSENIVSIALSAVKSEKLQLALESKVKLVHYGEKVL